MGSVLIYFYIVYVKYLLPLFIFFLLLQSCSKDSCGCSFAFGFDTGRLTNANAPKTEIRIKTTLPDSCDEYLGQTLTLDAQGFIDDEKDGDEFKYPLEMTSKIISTIDKGVIGEGYPYYLTRVGCN